MSELPATIASSVMRDEGEEVEKLLAALRDFVLLPDAEISFKVNTTPGSVAGLLTEFARCDVNLMLKASAGNGILHGHLHGRLSLRERALFRGAKGDHGMPAEQAASLLASFLEAVPTPGNLTITRYPAEWKGILPIWGRPTPDRGMMHRERSPRPETPLQPRPLRGWHLILPTELHEYHCR